MDPLFAVETLRSLVTTCLLVIAPILAVAITVGLVVSLVQTVTSIQEQTLTFVPKLVAVAGVLVIGAPWMLRHLMEFTIAMMEKMPAMVK